MREDISDDGLRPLVDMDVLHSDVLVTTVAKAAIGLELVGERPHKPSNSRSKSNGAIFRPSARA